MVKKGKIYFLYSYNLSIKQEFCVVSNKKEGKFSSIRFVTDS